MTADRKLLTIIDCVAIIASPFVLWFALYATARWTSYSLRPTLRWIRLVRWASWFAGLVAFIIPMFYDRFASIYGTPAILFSLGLRFPEKWVTRRFAPELLEAANPAGGWWSSKTAQ